MSDPDGEPLNLTGKDIALPNTAINPSAGEQNKGKVDIREQPVQLDFINEINGWLDSDSAYDITYPEGIRKGITQKVIVVDNPDQGTQICLTARTLPNGPKEGSKTHSIHLTWLNEQGKLTGTKFYIGYNDGKNFQYTTVEYEGISPERIEKWKKQGGVEFASSGQRSTFPDDQRVAELTTVLQGGTFNKTLTDSAMNHLRENYGAVRIMPDHTELPSGQPRPALKAAGTVVRRITGQ